MAALAADTNTPTTVIETNATETNATLPVWDKSWLNTPSIQPDLRTVQNWSLQVSRGSAKQIAIKVYTTHARLSLDFTSSFTFPFRVTFCSQYSQEGETKHQTLYESSASSASTTFSIQDVVAPSPGYFVLDYNNKSSWVSTLSITTIEWTVRQDNEAPCYAIGSVLVNNEPEHPRDLPLTATEASCLAIVRGYIETNPKLANVPMCCGVPLRHDTDTLLRFTRARDAHPVQVMEMLQKHIEWRLITLPISLPSIEKEIALKRIHVSGTSITGHYVVVVRCYRILNEGYDASTLVKAQLNLMGQFEEMDRLESWNDRGNRRPACYTTIVDCTGIKKPPLDFLKQLSAVLADNYPERSWKTVIVPVPGFVRVMVNGMLWFLDPVTRAKISICSSNEQCAQGGELEVQVAQDIMNESLAFVGKLIGDTEEEDEKKETMQ